MDMHALPPPARAPPPPDAAGLPSRPLASSPPAPLRPRSHSRSSSLSSSSVLQRAVSLREAIPDAAVPHKTTPPRIRRSSVNFAASALSGTAPGKLGADDDGARPRAAEQQVKPTTATRPSTAQLSHHHQPFVPLLPDVYAPPAPLRTASTPHQQVPPDSARSTPPVSASSVYQPGSQADYFSSQPLPAPPHHHAHAHGSPSQRSSSRTRPDRVPALFPLGSLPVAAPESDAHRATPPQHRSRSSTSASRETTHRPSSSRDHQDRRERRERDKKTMLSRALQKANTAVLLDNAQNFEGAMEAYSDACTLLEQVMIRTSGEGDRRKLESIHKTYTNRIDELRLLDPGYHPTGKSLPARPMSNDSLDEQRSMLFGDGDDDEHAIIQTATVTRIVNDRSIEDEPPSQALALRPSQFGGVRESVISTAIRDVQRGMSDNSFMLQAPPGRFGQHLAPVGEQGAESPMDRSYLPPPLSPRRPLSPVPPPKHEAAPPSFATFNTLHPPPERSHQPMHKRGGSTESTSWLDTIDESGGSSCSSSVHSLSPGGIHRKHIRNPSGDTEAEFDAALDAAVEAAYDEGYEPYEEEPVDNSAEVIASRLRDVEIAKERVREAEREEVVAAAKYRYNEAQLRNQSLPHVRESAEFKYNDEAEEEERLLDSLTKEYMLEGFDFDLQTKSSLPRQSDSSTFSGKTYHSSMSSHRTTGGTSLSTVAEVFSDLKLKGPAHLPPPIPPPTAPLPSISKLQAQATAGAEEGSNNMASALKENTSVRSRRLSGQNAGALKIETSLPTVPPAPHSEEPTVLNKEPLPELPPLPKTAIPDTFETHLNSIEPTNSKLPTAHIAPPPIGLRAPSPLPLAPSPAETTFTVSSAPTLSHAISNDTTLAPGSPKTSKGVTLGIKKNKSSLSLKQRNLSVSSPDGSDASIGTPLSQTFSFTGRNKSIAAPAPAPAPAPTPNVPVFNVDGLPGGGMHLFESDIHSPFAPGSPNETVPNAPIPLEPCPDAYLLRPFWLMRCFYQTIAHPRGGYLSNKLFIPRDVWRVKGVKLKNLDDKIANCDLLTAALQRLSTVDTLDADAVLEEMQALELVLDQVQAQLAKKLGNEVGVHGVSALFANASTVGSGAASIDGSEKGSHGSQDHAPKSAVAQGKSYLASWRKLRSKNSGLGLNNMAGSGVKVSTGDVPKESLTMATLPMTSLPNIKFAKRDLSSLSFEGPNSGYMSSLARLFDAVQILDQITRQVEDPGLKHSSPTHVGLELSARHAAEFFGFYVCRFVLTDVTLMLDKFIKRGSEWVLT